MSKKNGIISMATGIASLMGIWGSFNAPYESAVCLALAIVSLVFNKKAVEAGENNTFMKVGKITAIIGIILSAIGLVWGIICFCACGGLAFLSSIFNQ